ncbi:hypothetical protein EDD11_003774 [Mortierella claussenii]|nr:hypothetical protein EDD11_003774 [Mortierella claussenii]
MFGQRCHQKPSDCWIDREERDPGFNIMSPRARNYPFKGIRLPIKMSSVHPEITSNIMVRNASHLDERDHVWGIGEALFGIYAPLSTVGVSYLYTKGPAGQTPFPTLIALSGYFSTQSQAQSPPPCPSQSQSFEGYDRSKIECPPVPSSQTPAPLTSSTSIVYLGPQKMTPPMYPCPQESDESESQYEEGNQADTTTASSQDFWARAYPTTQEQISISSLYPDPQ